MTDALQYLEFGARGVLGFRDVVKEFYLWIIAGVYGVDQLMKALLHKLATRGL